MPHVASARAPACFSLLAVVLALAGCGGDGEPSASVVGVLDVASGRADMVSGGDALIRLKPATPVDPARIAMAVNQVAVGSAFRGDGDQGLVGMATGLRDGTNDVAVWQTDATGVEVPGTRSTLKVTNHPATGPIFSGPQEEPFFCQTHQFRLWTNGPFYTASPVSAPCTVPTRVDYLYRNAAGTFVPFDAAAARPADLSSTTTLDGRTVPYIVRLETGTLNRAVYQIAILHDPASAGDAAYAGWNRRLVYTFGGGCSGGMFIQGSAHGGVLDHEILSRGFAAASASLNVYRNNCNDVLSAETTLMVKEHFIEAYGPVKYTIGWGGSGGAVQQITMADNYPGILDGIVPRQSFPDLVQTAVVDARLMLNFFRSTGGSLLDQEALRLASGFGTFGQFANLAEGNGARFEALPTRAGWPDAAWNAVVAVGVRYDPVTNPNGARPTFYDHNVNTYGKDANGFARRPLDNVGVQYGLAALREGRISKTQFLDLNEKVGGVDIDFNFTASRTTADPSALKAAYETGKVLNGGGGLAYTPVLDVDGTYGDFAVNGDVHQKHQHFAVRERVRKANGSADNYVMWSGAFGNSAAAVPQALVAMDAWLAAIRSDTSAASRRDKVLRNKPAGLTDGCYSAGTFIAEPQFHGAAGSSQCNSLYPSAGYPLGVAGAPLSNDILKCQLRPVDLADYGVSFTPAEQARLNAIFPTGVCDRSRPGVEQRPLKGTWLRYTGVGTYEAAR